MPLQQCYFADTWKRQDLFSSMTPIGITILLKNHWQSHDSKINAQVTLLKGLNRNPEQSVFHSHRELKSSQWNRLRKLLRGIFLKHPWLSKEFQDFFHRLDHMYPLPQIPSSHPDISYKFCPHKPMLVTHASFPFSFSSHENLLWPRIQSFSVSHTVLDMLYNFYFHRKSRN